GGRSRWPPPSWSPTTGVRPTLVSTGSSGLPARRRPGPAGVDRGDRGRRHPVRTGRRDRRPHAHQGPERRAEDRGGRVPPALVAPALRGGALATKLARLPVRV